MFGIFSCQRECCLFFPTKENEQKNIFIAITIIAMRAGQLVKGNLHNSLFISRIINNSLRTCCSQLGFILERFLFKEINSKHATFKYLT